MSPTETPSAPAQPAPPSNGRRGLDGSSTAALAGGAPLAGLTVWLVETLYLAPRHMHFDATSATVVGSCGAIFFGELWMVLKRLLDKIGT